MKKMNIFSAEIWDEICWRLMFQATSLSPEVVAAVPSQPSRPTQYVFLPALARQSYKIITKLQFNLTLNMVLIMIACSCAVIRGFQPLWLLIRDTMHAWDEGLIRQTELNWVRTGSESGRSAPSNHPSDSGKIWKWMSKGVLMYIHWANSVSKIFRK